MKVAVLHKRGSHDAEAKGDLHQQPTTIDPLSTSRGVPYMHRSSLWYRNICNPGLRHILLNRFDQDLDSSAVDVSSS